MPNLWTGETHLLKKPLPPEVLAAHASSYTPKKGIVQVRGLPTAYAKLFYEGSRRKEANAIRPSITPLSWSEAQQVQRNMPERIMSTRWLDTWKEVDESEDAKHAPELNLPSNLQSKSRWIIKGFTDPDYENMTTDSPTPELAEIVLCFQLHSSMGWHSKLGDIKAAFNQSNLNMRAIPVYATIPDEGLPADDPLPEGTRLVRLEREVYGLLTSPAALRRTILEFLRDEAWVRHPLAPCIFTLYNSQGNLVSVLLLLVDDVLVAGEGPVYEEKL
eukprot:4091224-Amphidinium_carterae.1